MSVARRSPKFAVLPPLPSVYAHRELGAFFREKAHSLTALGRLSDAQQFTIAADEVRDASLHWHQMTSPSGSAEVPEPADGAESGSPPGHTEWWTSVRVGEELGMTDRGVRYAAARPDSLLKTVLTGGRRLFDPLSVLEEKRRRQGDDR